MLKLNHGTLTLCVLLQACAAPPPEKREAHPAALDRSPVGCNPGGSASGKTSPAEEPQPGAATPPEEDVCENDQANPGAEGDGMGRLAPMAFEPAPPPSGGSNPGGWGYPGGEHTGEPGDAFGHGFCDDPQYAGLCNTPVHSGAAAPGTDHPHPGSGPRSGGAYDLPGPSDADIADSKQAWRNIERRGENILKKYKDLYKDENEATGKACVSSCSSNFNALCGYVDSICSTGNTIIPMSPGVRIPCRAAKAATCEGDPNECIMDCSIASMNTSPSGHHSGDGGSPSPRMSRQTCRDVCDYVKDMSCLTVGFTCSAGAVWTFGGVAVPCYYAVFAACSGAFVSAKACREKWCDRR